MDLKELQDFLEKSFDDQHLSRAEANVFKQLLEDGNPDAHDLNLLRNQIFTIAQTAIRHPHDRQVLDWVEALVKIIISQTAPQGHTLEALFFPSDTGLTRIISVLSNAQRSLDICVFTITDNRLTEAIIDAHQRRVAVRVFTDDDKASDLGSDIVDLLRAGVPVRFDNSPNHMHHKFAIVDRSLLINGSFNWTRSASADNYENVVISDHTRLIHLFSQEFDRLWQKYAPAKNLP